MGYFHDFKYELTLDAGGKVLTLFCTDCNDTIKYFIGYEEDGIQCSCGKTISKDEIEKEFPVYYMY